MPQYTAPLAGQYVRIPAEHLRDAIREAAIGGSADVHDPDLIASTPGAADLAAEIERLKGDVAEASRAVSRHSVENKSEWQNPHTAAGRLDALNAERAALESAASAISAEIVRTRRDLWALLYVVDDETVYKRRKAAAAEADAQHARAVQALADLHDALERRERAYVTCGHPGDRAHFSVVNPPVFGTMQPAQVFTEGFRVLDALVPTFPTDVAGLFAEAEQEASR